MATAALPRIADYRLGIQWSTGTDADTSAYDEPSYQMPPGVTIDGIGRATARAFAPPGTPALDCALPNQDGIYSPGGILGLFVGRGPAVTYEADWGMEVLVNAEDVLVNTEDVLVNGTITVPMFTGAIDTAPQQIDYPGQVQIRALGSIARLQRTKPTTILYENIRTDVAIGFILDAAGWDADLREIDEGDTTLLYWWLNGQTDGLAAIRAILGAEGVPACAYIDGEGVFHFEGRQFRANATRSNTVQWTFADALGDGSLRCHVRPSQWGANPDEVVGQVRATVNVRTATSTQKIWEYGSALTLSALETRDVEVTDSDPFKSAVTPLLATDYTVSAGALSSISLLTTSGQTIILRLVAGVTGCTVIGVTSNGIQVRAVSLPVTSELPVTNTVDIGLSAARYEPEDHTLDLWPEIERNEAVSLADNFARRYQRPRDQMTIRIANIDAAHMVACLGVRISDRVRLIHTHGVIDDEFFVESLSHDLSNGGGLHLLTLNLEKVTDDIPAVYGTARYGFDSYSE